MSIESHLQRLEHSLASASAQISALKHQHSLLLSTLLSHPKTASILSSQSSLPRPVHAKARSTASTHAISHHARTVRASSGLTAFLVENPDPNARNKTVLGVRIDGVTNSKSPNSRVEKKRFIQPWFLFFEILDSDSGRLRLHRHTIPGCIPLKGLVRKYLGQDGENAVDEDEEQSQVQEQEKEQDLHAFVRAVRSEVIGMTKRKDAIEKIRDQCASNAENLVEEVEMMDPAARQFEIVFKDGMRAKVSVDTNGKINGAVARQIDDVGVGKRKRDVERIIMGEGGRIETLADRLIKMR